MNGQDKEQQLKEAISAGDPVTDIPLALQIDYFRVGPTELFRAGFDQESRARWSRSRPKAAPASRSSISSARFRTSSTRVAGNVRDYIKIKLDSG